MKNRKRIVILLLLLIVFGTLGFKVKNSSEGILFDVSILELLHKSTNIFIFNLMKIISFLGSWKILLPGLILTTVYLINKNKLYETRLIIINIFGSFILNLILKYFIQRTRPIEYFRVEQSGLSFPSGHSMVTMSMWLAIAYLLTRNEKDRRKKRLIKIGTSLFILLMGISRMYLGVHWPTDVLGGYIMGYIIFSLSIMIL